MNNKFQANHHQIALEIAELRTIRGSTLPELFQGLGNVKPQPTKNEQTNRELTKDERLTNKQQTKLERQTKNGRSVSVDSGSIIVLEDG